MIQKPRKKSIKGNIIKKGVKKNVKKGSTVKKNLENNQDDPKNFKNQIKWGVDALLNLVKDSPKKKSLIDDGESIFLQVSLVRIPQVEEMVKRRICLKHPPYAGQPEVCFIARDRIRKDRIKRTDDEKIDYTVERYEEFFKKQQITGITNILPYHQLKTEYNTYELRRKLVNRFDIFLCSSSLNSHDYFFQCLGKLFIKKNKFPISVKLPKFDDKYTPKANNNVQSAIASSIFRIREGADNYSIKIGNTLNDKKNIKENLTAVLDKITNSGLIPGGFENVRFIGIKSSLSKVVPLYINLNSGKNVPIPYVKPNVPVRESVEGELSTMLRKKVTVLPNGQVFVTPLEEITDTEQNEDDDEIEEELDDDGVEDEEGYIKPQKEVMQPKKGKRPRKEESEDEEDEDDIEAAIEAAEQKYLVSRNDYMEENSEDEHSEEKETKKKKKAKNRGNLNEKPAKKVKKEMPPPTKKQKKEDTKAKTNVKPGKEKNESQSGKTEMSKLNKKKKEILSEAKTNKMEKMKKKINGIEKKSKKIVNKKKKLLAKN